MFNNNSITKFKEELTRALILLKLKNKFERISEEVYKRDLDKIKDSIFYSDFIEELSEIGVMQVCDIIDMSIPKSEEYIIIFDEALALRSFKGYSDKKCDVLILSKDNIRVIKVVSMDYDLIEASDCEEIFDIGYAALDKYLSRTNEDVIGLAVLQPNLLAGSICGVKIDGLIESYNKEFLN